MAATQWWGVMRLDVSRIDCIGDTQPADEKKGPGSGWLPGRPWRNYFFVGGNAFMTTPS